MKKDYAKIYLNKARLEENDTWHDLDDLLTALFEEHDARKVYPNSNKYFENISVLIEQLRCKWDVYQSASSTLTAMLDETYGEIDYNEEDGSYMKEEKTDSELLKIKKGLEEMEKIANEALEIKVKEDDDAEHI